jgi:hypothetical protein
MLLSQVKVYSLRKEIVNNASEVLGYEIVGGLINFRDIFRS